MRFGQKIKPLLQCELRHALPGRARIGCRALRFLPTSLADIEREIVDTEGITAAKTSFRTANILIIFDPNQYTAESILDLVENLVSSYSLEAFKSERQQQATGTVNERRLQDEPLHEMATRVGVTTTTLIISYLRRGKPMSGHAGGLARFLTMPALTALTLAGPIIRNGLVSLKTHKRPNADTLSATAILASIAAGKDISALTIIWLADIAELLTGWTLDRTRKAIREFLSVGEQDVWKVLPDTSEVKVPIDSIQVGDLIAVHTGEQISVDGTVEAGNASVDQSSVTGEYMPATRMQGDGVFAGSIVKSGYIQVRAYAVGDDTACGRIVHMVEEAEHHRAPVQNFADRFSAAFIPVNFLLAGLVYSVTKRADRALNMLIIDYSCGVRLSTATALSASICAGASQGILIKGGNYLELLDEADTLILDKTGTITEGRPRVTSVLPIAAGITEERLLVLAAAAEETSSHPMATAIIEKVKLQRLKVPKHGVANVVVARGVSVDCEGQEIHVGSRRFMLDQGVDLSASEAQVHRLVIAGENIIYASSGKKLLGLIGVQDALRENMKKSLNRLRLLGLDDIILLTGDVEQHAEIVSGRMAMDRYHAEALPEDKADMVLRLQSKGTHVIMVGDGINDAPALAYADVGVAMGGTRTDIAMESADITIAGDDPLLLPGVVQLGRRTMKTIRQNFGISIGVNTTGLILSSMGVLPVFWGAVLHNACTVAVVANSGRLLLNNVTMVRR